MPEALFSSSWYRVAGLRPRLRNHARIHRHVYRGRPWYVLEDVVNQRVHRFTPATHAVIGLMDGERSVQDLWEVAADNLGDEAPTQDELIRLLAQLHAADVLQCDVPPDSAELLERFEKRERQQFRARLLSPLAMRVPLFDPDRFLARLVPLVRPLMGPLGALLWLAVVLPALFQLGVHWNELTNNMLDHVLGLQNLALIWLLFPVIKVLHELGHGLATRYFGGEVHDMGVMLLVFTPVPYVDASSASAFPRKGQRALVASAGIIVEVFLAALAFYVWMSVEPGVVRTLAYNTMLIGGVTTLTFNANPLLRFDGYYILSDLIEIPNLRQRSNAQISYLFERRALGNAEAEPPDTAGLEPIWLVAYGVGAFVYRIVLTAFIMLLLLDISLPLGVLLFAISSVFWIGRPVYRGLYYLFKSPRLRRSRTRAVSVVLGGVALLLLVLFALPLPYRTRVAGVAWVPEEALVRAESSGFVERLLAAPGSTVRAGDPLIACRDPDLVTAVAVLEAQLHGLEVRHQQARVEDLSRAKILAEEIRHAEHRLGRARERRDGLLIRAPRGGLLVVPQADDLLGRYVEQGALLAYVVQPDRLTVRAVVPQEDMELVSERLRGVAVRRADRLTEVLEAKLERFVPAASAELPSVALGSEGGGQVAVDPRDPEGTSAVQPIFQVELTLPRPEDLTTLGGHVHVRFDHGLESLAARGWRSLRQLVLARLDV